MAGGVPGSARVCQAVAAEILPNEKKVRMARNTSSWSSEYFNRGILSCVLFAGTLYGIWEVGVLLGGWVELRVGEGRAKKRSGIRIYVISVATR